MPAMLRLLTDENVHGDIIAGLRRRQPALDLVRVQDVGLRHTPDPIILEGAARARARGRFGRQKDPRCRCLGPRRP